MKKSLFLTIFVLIASLMLSACSPAAPEQPPVQDQPAVETPADDNSSSDDDADDDQDTLEDGEELEMTLEELAEFDGTNGKKAYVAVDGIIYDVTDSEFWKNGAHNGFQAGRDLTKEIKEISPHGVKNLERVERVGKIDD